MERLNKKHKGMVPGVLIIRCNYSAFRIIGSFIPLMTIPMIISSAININTELPELIGSIVIFVISVLLLIFTPYWADKVFPFFFRKYLIIDDKNIQMKKKDRVLANVAFEHVDIVYYSIWDGIFGGYGCCIVIYDKEKVDSHDNRLIYKDALVTKKQYKQIKEWIENHTNL